MKRTLLLKMVVSVSVSARHKENQAKCTTDSENQHELYLLRKCAGNVEKREI